MWFKTAANDSSSSRYIGVRDDALRRKNGGTKAEYYTDQWTIYSSLVLTDWCDVFVNNNVNTTNKVVWYAALPTTSLFIRWDFMTLIYAWLHDIQSLKLVTLAFQLCDERRTNRRTGCNEQCRLLKGGSHNYSETYLRSSNTLRRWWEPGANQQHRRPTPDEWREWLQRCSECMESRRREQCRAS